MKISEVRDRLAVNLKALRAKRAIAQERLALEAGIDRTMLSKIERKLSNPSVETLLRLANRLDVDIVDLLRPLDPGAVPLIVIATDREVLHDEGAVHARVSKESAA